MSIQNLVDGFGHRIPVLFHDALLVLHYPNLAAPNVQGIFRGLEIVNGDALAIRKSVECAFLVHRRDRICSQIGSSAESTVSSGAKLASNTTYSPVSSLYPVSKAIKSSGYSSKKLSA